MLGKIHSIESMALVDGPGVRSVVFLQGCLLRCKYCHNPDTWQRNEKCTLLSAKELTARLLRFKEYYGEKGGVTLSGGEPLLQLDFALELFTLLKEKGIHTCLDTAGAADFSESLCGEKIEKLLSLTDLCLLDVKHHDEKEYKALTGQSMKGFQSFLPLLKKSGVPIWVRHVVVPSITDSKKHIQKLKEYIGTIANVEKIELLPYHTLGVSKYEALNIPYPLKNTPAISKSDIAELYDIINS